MSGLQFPGNINTLLVDDEEIALHRLRKALQPYPQINIIGEAKDGRSAVAFINSQRPDLVFLDIQMPGFNGFEVLSQLAYTPVIVFVTAYEEYAVKAFEKNSLDYLLKPVEDARLALTMQRISEFDKGEVNMLQKIKELLQESPREKISTIPVKTGGKIQFIQVDEICFLEARDNMCISILLQKKDWWNIHLLIWNITCHRVLLGYIGVLL